MQNFILIIIFFIYIFFIHTKLLKKNTGKNIRRNTISVNDKFINIKYSYIINDFDNNIILTNYYKYDLIDNYNKNYSDIIKNYTIF